MSARYNNVAFDEGTAFEVNPRFGRKELEGPFNTLKEELTDELLAETETIELHARLKQAANEAAGLAWTTEFPLLVFPALFDELARRERARLNTQQRIRARTEHLMPV